MAAKRKVRRRGSVSARRKRADEKAREIYAGMEMVGLALMCGCDPKKLGHYAKKLFDELEKFVT